MVGCRGGRREKKKKREAGKKAERGLRGRRRVFFLL